MDALRKALGANPDMLLIVGMIGILAILFAPVPAHALDFLLLLNFSVALLLLLITFYVEKPVGFSTYPSLLLIATLFRLSLNISATRLILGNADGGRVIGAIGSFVVQGNFVIGVVVFLILVVVQYVVVTSGAQRVAEVAARFTLDSMPGQQMSIDADLNMGFIDQAEAQRRRKNIEKEANFYGAMDGASKFVKGDAIAGILIMLIDIFGGLIIGVTQLGMSWLESAQTFTLLTVGDGIVTQVPALVIAVGTGILITRSGTDGRLSHEILGQIGSVPKAMGLVAMALLGVGFLPGMPMLPVGVIVLFLIGCAILVRRSTSVISNMGDTKVDARSGDLESYKDLLTVPPIEVRVGQNLVGLINGEDSALVERISAFRKQFILEAGIVLPRVRFRDDKRLTSAQYDISVHGLTCGMAELVTDRMLAIHPSGTRGKLSGIETNDPTYGLPAVWIDESQKSTARAAGFTLVDPLTVFLTHLTETLRRNAANLMTRSETTSYVDRVRESNPGLVDELTPGILALAEVQKVLQGLLREKVSIHHAEAILEVLADAGRSTKDATRLTEIVRQRLGPAICQALASANGEIRVITLDPTVEQKINGSIQSVNDTSRLILDPRFAEQVVSRLSGMAEQMVKNNLAPVLLCAPDLRRHIRTITERVLPQMAVLSMAEIPSTVSLRSYGVIKL